MNTLERLGLRGERGDEDEGNEEDASSPMRQLRIAAAQLLLATGTGAAVDQMQRDRQAGFGTSEPVIPDAPRRVAAVGAVWAPLLIGPAAAVANLAHAARPSAATQAAARVLNAAAIGVGIAGLAGSAYAGSGGRRRTPSLAPLALGSAGLLGALLERAETQLEREHERLERRASWTERLVPRRRPKLDRIVVHV